MKSDRVIATVAGQSVEIVKKDEHHVLVDGRRKCFNVARLGIGHYSLILDGVVYDVYVENDEGQVDANNGTGLGRKLHLAIGGRGYSVTLENDRSILLKSLLKNIVRPSAVTVISAPMPGLIVKVEVQVGQAVRQGQGLLILEAMKMENEIRAGRGGTIQAIHVESRKPVEKGEPLISVSEE